MQDEVVNEFEGPYFPFNRREHYPRQLKVDFRKLTRKTLLTYTAHHELHMRPDSTHEELAIAAARHFAVWRVNEESIIRSFIARMTTSTLGARYRHGLGDDAEGVERKRKHIEKPLEDVVPPLPQSPVRREQRVQKRRRHDLRLSSLQGYHYDEEDKEGNEEKGDDGEEENWDGGKERRMSPPSLPRYRTQHGEEASRSDRLPRYLARGSGTAPTVIPVDDGSSSDDTDFDLGQQVAAYMACSWILERVLRDM